MAETAADVLMETLHDCGVEVIFGLPGDGINGLINARAATTLTRVAGHAHRPWRAAPRFRKATPP